MRKLKDEIHHCDDCDIYPCSTQEIVLKSNICRLCPISCCRYVLVVLAPCEEMILENKNGALKMKENGWCYYYNEQKRECIIYEIRPVICRIASCRFIREGKIPKELERKEKYD